MPIETSFACSTAQMDGVPPIKSQPATGLCPQDEAYNERSAMVVPSDATTTAATIADAERSDLRKSGPRHVVVLVHGIRDFALWQNNVRDILEAEGFKSESTNYGRFNLVEFLLPFSYFRKKAIKEVWRQIRIVKQNNPDALLSIIAHSFGTYVVANLMRENFDLAFHRVIFCGSVVRYGFEFEDIQNRFFPPIINEVGTRDVFPALAESVAVGYGSAGTYGFRRPLTRDRWHNDAGHGFFLTGEFCKHFWVPWLRNGTFVHGAPKPAPPPLWIRLLSVFKIKYFAALGLAALAFPIWSYISDIDYRPKPIPPSVVRLDPKAKGSQDFELILAPIPVPAPVSLSLKGQFLISQRTIHGELQSGSFTTIPNPLPGFPERLTRIGFAVCYFKRVGTGDQVVSFPSFDFFKPATPVDVRLERGKAVELPRLSFAIDLPNDFDLSRGWLCGWLFGDNNAPWLAQ